MNEIDYSLSVDTLPAEAWVPKVGDRVIVHVSPECAFHAADIVEGARIDGDGKTGTILDDLMNPQIVAPNYDGATEECLAAGHRWFVWFDDVLFMDSTGKRYRATDVATAELERLP